MILYLDTSALAKQYIREAASAEVAGWIGDAVLVGTSLIARAEMEAVLGRLRRMEALTEADASQTLTAFRQNWPAYIRLPVLEATAIRAGDLAWRNGLSGYDAVHLAAAVLWQEALDESVTMLTYDRQLWNAARATGLGLLPSTCP